MARDLVFIYDLACPYAYLASERIKGLAESTGARLVWWPVTLGGLWRNIGAADTPGVAWSDSKRTLLQRDLTREAELAGVPLPRPQDRPARTIDALRLLWCLPDERRGALSVALFRAFWVDGQDLTDADFLNRLAREAGLQDDCWRSAQARNSLFEATDAAAEWGVFGVPAFRVGARIWWGQDRMALVARALGAPESPRAPPASKSGRRFRFFYDFSSPYAYLASTQMARIAAEQGATLEPVPILLGALFRKIGTPNVPMFAMPEPKQRYTAVDLTDWAGQWQVPLRFPSIFPIRSVLALRLALLEPAAIDPLFKAAWAEDRDICSPAVCRQVLREARLPADDLLARAELPETKAALRANTDAALAAGLCGVPTWQVDDVIVWGQDRLHQLEALLQGWRPARG